jgi:hypothetical protein
MKGKIKVMHDQEITLTFSYSEGLDALTLAGKYIGKHGFKCTDLYFPNNQFVMNGNVETDQEETGYIDLSKNESVTYEKPSEPPAPINYAIAE